MPVSKDQLRQLLAERSDPARHRPVPQERITARIRRARMKRAAGAGLLAVAVAAGVVSGVTPRARARAGHAASYSGPPLPARFTAADGAAYRRLAVTDMTDPAQKTATLTVQVGSDPVDVMASCDDPTSNILIGVKVNGTLAGLVSCQDPSQLLGLPVHPGQQARITLVRASGLGLPDISTDWQFAAYAWTPPATARTAPAAPHLPQSYTGPNTTAGHGNALRKLVAIRSGIWPRDQTATFTFTVHGHRNFDISTVCAGLIGDRLQVSHQIDGSGSEAVSCTPRPPATGQRRRHPRHERQADHADLPHPGTKLVLRRRLRQAPGQLDHRHLRGTNVKPRRRPGSRGRRGQERLAQLPAQLSSAGSSVSRSSAVSMPLRQTDREMILVGSTRSR